MKQCGTQIPRFLAVCRIDHCMKWRDMNFMESPGKKDFNLIYSNDIVCIKEILPVIERVWDTKNAHGTMNI